ncbi:MAG: pyridoxal phosphate-dependent aminotransferase [Polyangiales bacterium]
MRFSTRTRFPREENELSRVIAEARALRPLLDLTESNPTRAGLCAHGIEELGHPRGALYEPDPLGHREAREAVARYYADKNVAIDPARIVLSASTSEAYGWLFKLLCDRDDNVLVPTPSYPLFDYLAALEDVRLVQYPLDREHRFRVDLHALEAAIDDRTRAILLVHPNNPTGTLVHESDAIAIEELAAKHGLAVIADEVFLDYARGARTFAGHDRALTFVLSGLSKVVALPQVKLGWIAVSGPEADEALARLEVVADTYLSVGTPIQRALPTILERRHEIQSAIRARVDANLRALDVALSHHPAVRRLPSDGGWCAILEVPRTRTEDAWVELLVQEESVIVQPGWFFDLDREGYLVVSLLPERFPEAIDRIVARLADD